VYLAFSFFAQPWNRVNVALGVVEIMARLGIDAFYGPEHLRSEENVVDRNDFSEQVYARLMVHAGIKVDVPQQKFSQRGALQILRDTAITAPMIGNRAAAMRDYEFQGGEILKNVGGHELPKSRRVAVQIMRAGGVKIWIARAADVDHGGDI